MHLKQLTYLRLVVEHGGFAAAARAAGVSQPAITLAMQALEREWGVPLFEKAGTEVNRLEPEDVDKFQALAVPIWFKWANKDKDAARLFKAQLEIMQSPSFGYVTPDMVKGLKIDL